MKLTELRKLEKGALLRLKGTDVIFKLHEVDAVNHQVSEEIKDLYRRAGYNVAVETIQW